MLLFPMHVFLVKHYSKIQDLTYAAVAEKSRELLLCLMKSDFTSKEHGAHVQCIFETW